MIKLDKYFCLKCTDDEFEKMNESAVRKNIKTNKKYKKTFLIRISDKRIIKSSETKYNDIKNYQKIKINFNKMKFLIEKRKEKRKVYFFFKNSEPYFSIHLEGNGFVEVSLNDGSIFMLQEHYMKFLKDEINFLRTLSEEEIEFILEKKITKKILEDFHKEIEERVF